MDTASAWSNGKPIYDRLPGANLGYRTENEATSVSRWLTAYFDELLVGTKTAIDDLPRQLDPDRCDASWLDFLAVLCGFTGEYWDKSWNESIKRSLLRNSYSLIWANKGSQQVLEFLLSLFEIEHDIWLGNDFIVGKTPLPATLGSPEWQYFIRLPLRYLRDSIEFKRAEQLNRLYGPAFADGFSCYDYFYAGFSVCGDPVFDSDEISLETGNPQALLLEDGAELLLENGQPLLLEG